ncbi:hypothetical protein G9A89_023071 [Geosiphon pyriformis]|nr:hypothetical protein G9A89_023071 [Geosiphon pyriformis]
MSRKLANLYTYLMKAIYKQLLVVVRKRLYNRDYSGVQCLLYGKVELFDYVFTCSDDSGLFIRSKHKVNIEKTGLVKDSGIVLDLFYYMRLVLSDGVVLMFSIINFFAIRFNRHKLCCCFSGLGSDVCVHISV